MAVIDVSASSDKSNPLDLIEKIIEYNHWSFNRKSDCEIAAQAPGAWCDYSLYFTWNNLIGALHLSCAFDMRVPFNRQAAVYELLANVNEHLWLGYFGIWQMDQLPIFRHVIPFRGNSIPTIEQMEDLVETAVYECERFYPAFQSVIWGGKTPEYAINAAMIETYGEA